MRASVVSGLVALVFLPPPQFTIPAGKHLPFASIAPASDPLAICDAKGQPGPSQPSPQKQRENTAKNNLWVATTPTAMEFDDFTTLQAAVGNSPHLTSSRNKVETPRKVTNGNVGEGSLVQLVAHMRDAHIADCLADQPGKPGEHGESVNCDLIGVRANDFHITLMPLNEPNGNECDSVTAEIIPHFRPDAWQMLDQKTPTNNVVRLTGTLFFDDSHQPCDPQTKTPAPGNNPARRSVWEIHPVYALDVCTATKASDCTATNNAAWTPYDKWVSAHTSETTITDEGGARASCNALAGNKPVAPPIPARGHSE